MTAAAGTDVRFLLSHPAHWIALGFGSGLSPKAPGTVGTLWAWLMFLLLDRWLHGAAWGMAIIAAFVVGCWACTVTSVTTPRQQAAAISDLAFSMSISLRELMRFSFRCGGVLGSGCLVLGSVRGSRFGVRGHGPQEP